MTQSKSKQKKQAQKSKAENEADFGATQGNVCLLSLVATDLSTLLHKQNMEHPSAIMMAKYLAL